MLEELANFGAIVDVFDPWVDADEVRQVYGISLLEQPGPGLYDAIILAVGMISSGR